MPVKSSTAQLSSAFARCRSALFGIGVFSAAINILALTGPVYMLQLYDRVLPSHSVPTLIGLTILMLVLYAGFGLFDMIRTRMLSRVGVRLDRSLRAPVMTAVMLLPLRVRSAGDSLQVLSGLTILKGLITVDGGLLAVGGF